MGRKITIIGADFSAVAINVNEVEYPQSELLTQQGAYKVLRTTPKALEYSSNSSWRSAILPLENNMAVENACALLQSRVGDFTSDTPAIIYLNADNISGYIVDSEVYPTSGGDSEWGVFHGTLNPPAGATHVIIQTLLPPAGFGNLSSVISWSNEE